MLELLDGLLLIFIFVELLYAVRTSLRSHEIVAEPFLIVGILACIKEIVVLSVEAAWCSCSHWRSTCCGYIEKRPTTSMPNPPNAKPAPPDRQSRCSLTSCSATGAPSAATQPVI